VLNIFGQKPSREAHLQRSKHRLKDEIEIYLEKYVVKVYELESITLCGIYIFVKAAVDFPIP
jgi:hypothetical protein